MIEISKMEQMKSLIELLNQANHSYYNESNPIMTDEEYDRKYDLLLQLEKDLGTTLSNSPTVNVGYQVVSSLNKVEHSIPLLSLNKTKSLDELGKFIGNNTCVLSLKLDGLTTKLEYKNGELSKGSTRGSGKIGEDITHNISSFKNVPLKVDGDMTVVGESIITYGDFEEANNSLSENDKYSNPRNLASGSVRQLDSNICKQRNVRFIAYGVQNYNLNDSKESQLQQLIQDGFDTVPYCIVDKSNYKESADYLKWYAEKLGFPIDGLVCTYNDLKYADSLGMTSKYPKHSLAFKFGDEEYETTFTGLEMNTTRTGMISLVAKFEPVDIEGVMVSKASLHNVDIFESLQLGIGDTITVRRANMVIPQVMDNLTRSNTLDLPSHCPVCNSKAEVKAQKEARFLYCSNEECAAKSIQKIIHYVSRDAMNIVGLSESTIEKFVDKGFISNAYDLYSLSKHKTDILKMDGFGSRSYNKLIDSIEKSKDTEFANFIYGLGIPNVGKTTAKTLSKSFNVDDFINVKISELLKLDDIGKVVANSITDWLKNEDNITLYNSLKNKLNFNAKENVTSTGTLDGMVFVVTGSVEIYKNRKELQSVIESHGGKIASSVSKTTTYLLNNDVESNSSKNKKAKDLGVRIISEADFVEMIGS